MDHPAAAVSENMLRRRFLDRPQSLLLRKFLFQVHLWTGVGVGVYMSVMGISGSALVFREELEQRAHPTLYPAAAPDGTAAPIVDVIRNIEAAYPDHRVASIYSPTRGRSIFSAFVQKDGRTRTVLASPSGRVLGERPETGFITWLQQLHVNLLAGTSGRLVNGLGALLLLLLCMTGSVIWWPGVNKWRQSTRVDFRKTWKRVAWELHSATGFWTVVVLSMWALTGMYFSFPGPFQKVVGRLSPLTAGTVVPSDPSRGPQRADIGGLIKLAEGAVTGGQVAGVVLPSGDRGSVLVQLSRSQPDDLDTSGYVHFTFDQYSGALLNTWDQVDRSTGDTVLSWMVPLHFGTFGGVPLRIVWVLLGLGPPLLFVTGVVMWWNRVLRKKWCVNRLGVQTRRAAEPESGSASSQSSSESPTSIRWQGEA